MVSVTSGTRPTNPSDCFSVSLYAVALLTEGFRRNSTPVVFEVMFFLLPSSCAFERSYRLATFGFPSAGFCNVRVHHLQRVDDTVELVFRYKCELQRGLLEGEIVVQCIVGDIRGFVGAEARGKRGHKTQ